MTEATRPYDTDYDSVMGRIENEERIYRAEYFAAAAAGQCISTRRGVYHRQAENWLKSGRTQCGRKLHYHFIEPESNVLSLDWRETQIRLVGLCLRCFRAEIQENRP